MKEIFEKQRDLMEQLAPVEISLGYSPPAIPLDFSQRKDQDWFRLMSWYLVEEIVEAQMANPEDQPEELADCLHFATELCILAGVSPQEVQLYGQMDIFNEVPWQFTLSDVIVSLGTTNNMLKAKHWKKNPQPTDLKQFRAKVGYMLYQLVKCIEATGNHPDTIYFAKHKKNEERIQNNY